MTTILIVDDDPEIQKIFTTLLNILGYSTLSAAGGEECLMLLKQNHPDLILLDLMMEPMDGWQTLTMIKTHPEMDAVPVLMVTGKKIDNDELKKHHDKFKLYLMKPVTARQLKDAIEGYIKSP